MDRANSHHKVTFTVALKQQNVDQLEAKFWPVADPEHEEWQNFMSIDEIDAMIC